MKYLLDTNVCITYFGQRQPRLMLRFALVSAADKYTCSIVRAELLYGVAKSQQRSANLRRTQHFLDQFVSLPFDDEAAWHYGDIRAELERRGTPIGHHDMQIAAIALTHNLTLVTHNTREFQRVPGLLLADWEL